jgi:hypothetical protein
MPNTKTNKEKPVLLETVFGRVTKEEFDKKQNKFNKDFVVNAKKGDRELSNVLQAGERGADKAVSKIMKNVPGSSGPPKGLVDALEPAIRYLGRRSRGENTDKKAAGGVVKPRGYGMARGGKACKMM